MTCTLFAPPKNHQNKTPLDFTRRSPGCMRECGSSCTCNNIIYNRLASADIVQYLQASSHFLSALQYDSNSNQIKQEHGTRNAEPQENPPNEIRRKLSEMTVVPRISPQGFAPRQFDDPRIGLSPNSRLSPSSPVSGGCGGYPLTSQQPSPGSGGYPSSSQRSSPVSVGYPSPTFSGASAPEAFAPPPPVFAPPPPYGAYNPTSFGSQYPPQQLLLPKVSLNAMISFHPSQTTPSPKTSPVSIEDPKDSTQLRSSPASHSQPPPDPKRKSRKTQTAPRKPQTAQRKIAPRQTEAAPTDKDPAQMDRRTRNNLAAKRSRDLRRKREDEIAKRCQRLMNMHESLSNIKSEYLKLIAVHVKKF